tara:strand:+ start:431 stop:634 length:204 start_codon:yes stop_codon:yes gene_type:complete
MSLNARIGIKRTEPTVSCVATVTAAQMREILGIARGIALRMALDEHGQMTVSWNETKAPRREHVMDK